MGQGTFETQAFAARTMLERFLPTADIVMTRNVVVMATPEVTYAALKNVNFAKIGGPLMRALTALRVLAVRRARYRLGLEALPMPAKITLENIEDFGQIRLGETPGTEIVVGAIARPGDVESLFERRMPTEFQTFECAGYMKAAAGFRVIPYGAKRSLVTYEVRIRATDTRTRRKLFFWYNMTAPLMRLTMRRVVQLVRKSAERQCAVR